jgi:hypothetical protein
MKTEEALRFHSILDLIETNQAYDCFLYDFDFIDTIYMNYSDKTLKYIEYTKYPAHDNISVYRCYEKWGHLLWKPIKLHMKLEHVISDMYSYHHHAPIIEINHEHRFPLERYIGNFDKYKKNMKNILVKALSSRYLPIEVIDIIHDKVIDDYEQNLKQGLRRRMAKYH